MSVDVTAEARIRRRPEVVAAFAMDPANDARWIGALRSVRTVTDGASGRHARRAHGAVPGRRMTYVNEIVEYDPPRRLAMRSVSAPFPMTVVYEVEPAPGGATMRIRTGGDAGRYYRLVAPLLSPMVRRGVRHDLRQFATILEDGAGDASA